MTRIRHLMIFSRRPSAWISHLQLGQMPGPPPSTFMEGRPTIRVMNGTRWFSKSAHDTTISSFQLFDTLSGNVQTLPGSSSATAPSPSTPSDTNSPSKALAWYTCGPTTYAPAHMGHARTYVCLDIIRRVLESQSRHGDNTTGSPLFVMNITNVDDKILAAAKEQGRDPLELAKHFEDEFWKDLQSLNCLRPHVVTRVTDYVDSDIIPFIQTLLDKGCAYETDNGIYFDVRAYEEQLGKVTKYGKLAPSTHAQDITITAADEESATSTITQSFKKDARDFVLWKPRKEGEELWWSSPFGEGRPGWHIECSAMIEAVQRQFQDTHQFLVHAGGIDLKFPHHTNEIAQSEAYRSTSEWIPHWVHTGHLHIDGLKMSKSLKNFVTIQEFLKEFGSSSSLESPADDFRLWCLGLSGSYRSPATFSRERIHEARTIRKKIVRFLVDGENWLNTRQQDGGQWSTDDVELFRTIRVAQERCLKSLKNDMDGASFLKELVHVVEFTSRYMKVQGSDSGQSEVVREALSIVREQLKLVGFSKSTYHVGTQNDTSGIASSMIVGGESALVEELVNIRSAIREIALNDVKSKSATEGTKEILRICDEARDKVLPGIGVELFDGRSGGDNSGWQFCLPKTPGRDTEKESSSSCSSGNAEPASIEELFKVGKYEGMFSKYTDDGIPILNADGSEVSKRLLKKLKKKRDSYVKRKSANKE